MNGPHTVGGVWICALNRGRRLRWCGVRARDAAEHHGVDQFRAALANHADRAPPLGPAMLVVPPIGPGFDHDTAAFSHCPGT
jgi:hypothetical protein